MSYIYSRRAFREASFPFARVSNSNIIPEVHDSKVNPYLYCMVQGNLTRQGALTVI